MRFIALLVFVCPSVLAMLNATAEKDAVHVEKEAVHVDPIKIDGTATATGNGIMHPGAILATLRLEKDAIVANATASTTAPLINAPITIPKDAIEVPVNVTTQPNAFHIELNVQPGAIVVHAEGVTDAATGPIKRLEAAVTQGASKAEVYLMYFIAFLVASIAVGICFHMWHVKHLRNQLERKSHEKLS